MTGHNNRFADRLKAAREAQQLSQRALAKEAGLSPGRIGQLEKGDGYPRIQKLDRFAGALKITRMELLTWIAEDGDNDLPSADRTIPGLLCRLIPNSGRSTTFRRTGTDSVLLSAVPA